MTVDVALWKGRNILSFPRRVVVEVLGERFVSSANVTLLLTYVAHNRSCDALDLQCNFGDRWYGCVKGRFLTSR